MHLGIKLRDEISEGRDIPPFVGVYDCFSARVAAKHSPNLFLSGFGFAASYYGLPDIGYIAWSDMVQAAWRIRQILPNKKLLVDIDDGYVDTETACHVTRQLDNMGVAMVMLEDQARPRRCGHFEGKILVPLDSYIDKLKRVLETRENIRVLARTDASGDEIYRRIEAMSKTDADVVLVDGVRSMDVLEKVRSITDKPMLFNQIAGGKSPNLSIAELRKIGVAMSLYSTPCLFSAQHAMNTALDEIFSRDGRLLTSSAPPVGVKECTDLLMGNT